MHDVNWLSPYSVSVCLFKVKSPDVFDIWVCKLRHHRLFRQNEIVRSPRDATLRTFPPSASAESPQNTSSSAHQNKVILVFCLCVYVFVCSNYKLIRSRLEIKFDPVYKFSFLLIVHKLAPFPPVPNGSIMGRKSSFMLTITTI